MAGTMHKLWLRSPSFGLDSSSAYRQVYPDCRIVAYQLNILHTPLQDPRLIICSSVLYISRRLGANLCFWAFQISFASFHIPFCGSEYPNT